MHDPTDTTDESSAQTSEKECARLQKFIQSAKRSSKRYWNDGDFAWQEYLGHIKRPSSARARLTEKTEKYPIWWSTIRTAQPAIYSRVPTVIGKRRFDNDDPIGRTASLIVERLAPYLMECTNFDRSAVSARDDFLMTGRGILRVHFDATFTKDERQQVYPQFDGAGQITTVLDGTGQAIALEGDVELIPGEQPDTYYLEREDVTDHKAIITPVAYRDFIHTPGARYWDEVTEIGFRCPITRKQFKKRFPDFDSSKLNFSSDNQKRRSNEGDDQDREVIDSPDEYCIL